MLKWKTSRSIFSNLPEHSSKLICNLFFLFSLSLVHSTFVKFSWNITKKWVCLAAQFKRKRIDLLAYFSHFVKVFLLGNNSVILIIWIQPLECFKLVSQVLSFLIKILRKSIYTLKWSHMEVASWLTILSLESICQWGLSFSAQPTQSKMSYAMNLRK